MCREYTVTNSCGHTHDVMRFCNATLPCLPLAVDVKELSLCQECSVNPLAYMSTNAVSIDLDLMRAKDGMEEKCTRASQLVENEIPTPAGQPGPFIARITHSDFKLLIDIYDYMESVVLRRFGPDPASQQQMFRAFRLLARIALCIEEASIEFVEDGFFALNSVLGKYLVEISGQVHWPVLCTPINVMHLPKDKRECGICFESYVSKDDEDREEEEPVELPCEHVWGKRCIEKHFEAGSVSCPLCQRNLDPDQYLIDSEPIGTPWWMKHIKGEPVA
ncbi:hypothetical protein NA56DRAFT_697034 [Hyaloscypha hepaticicola]|uniref:RING-type domain-containing protein n=1 Tax=Hyaloscypha hepaticicola TaxID=2082293 RepID=A0A2J6QP03_9HELO|nr:hypothetical protein NA56DRAFT_697034 [Hyaloscypha hepaticicola]